MTKEQMQETGYHSAFFDCYHFLRRFGEVEDNDHFWNDAAAEATTIAKKREGTALEGLTNGLLSVIYDEPENVRQKSHSDRQNPAENADMEGGDIS